MKARRPSSERQNGRARPRVEPLSQKAWERVQERVFERIERGDLQPLAASPQRGLPSVPHWLGAAAVVAAAASVLLWWRSEGATEPEVRARAEVAQVIANPSATVTSLAPLALVPASGLGQALATASSATETTRIVTTTAATETTIGEAEITLAARSEANFSGSDATGWLVRLERGEVDCHVAPRHGRPAFVVQAGDTRVSVVGTRFSVSRDGAAVAVRVREGHVRVNSGSLELMLGPGEQWPPARASQSRQAAPASRARARFERAARLEASAPEQALTLYDELARSRGPWSANALYAQARLEFERGGLPKAKTLLLRYAERHPSGLNAVDVRELLHEIDTRQH